MTRPPRQIGQLPGHRLPRLFQDLKEPIIVFLDISFIINIQQEQTSQSHIIKTTCLAMVKALAEASP